MDPGDTNSQSAITSRCDSGPSWCNIAPETPRAITSSLSLVKLEATDSTKVFGIDLQSPLADEL